jgi:3',5'-cyclic AMP phosphodiesterase CpdA
MLRYLVFVAALACCGGGEKPPATVDVAVPAGHVRLIVGGDSRDDSAHVLPWAFREAKARGASAFVFLGDMELTPSFDAHFRHELDGLAKNVGFFPVLGNHEVRILGAIPLGLEQAQKSFKKNFLESNPQKLKSALPHKIVYSVNLPGRVHFIALDNVSQAGFGDDQLDWLEKDLTAARGDPEVRHIFVGMHKPLAHNGISSHGMEEDGDRGEKESASALEMFKMARVELILASHVHEFARFYQGGIRSYITGGLGAPLVRSAGDRAFHHFLVVDIAGDAVDVEVVRFDGKPTYAPDNVEDGVPD